MPRRAAADGVSRRASSASPGTGESAPDWTICATIRPIASASRASPMRPSASAALPCTSGDGSASAAVERLARAGVADEAERERRHLPDLGLRIAEQADERIDAFGEADAADRERRAPAHARFLVRQQAQRSAVSGGGGGGRCRPFATRRGRRDGRRGIAQHALVLQPEDPRHLLFEGRARGGGRGRRGRRAGAGGRGERQRQREDRADHEGLRTPKRPTGGRSPAAGASRAPTRASTIATPSPAPAGTPIVPSAATSIGGSIRSGSK